MTTSALYEYIIVRMRSGENGGHNPSEAPSSLSSDPRWLLLRTDLLGLLRCSDPNII